MIGKYYKNSLMLILVESLISALVIIILSEGIEQFSEYPLLESIYMIPLMYLYLVNFAFLAKLLSDFIPKTIVQYILFKKYSGDLKLVKLWFWLMVIGILIAIGWWYPVNFVFEMSFNTTVAISYVPAVILSPFILKKLGWDIIKRATRPTETKQ